VLPAPPRQIDANAIEEKIAEVKAAEDAMGKPLDPNEPEGDEYA
jgi:tetrahydromethanopterin S-methyltransferase subunit B